MKKIYILLLISAFTYYSGQTISDIFINQNGSKTILFVDIDGISIKMDTDGNLLQVLFSGEGDLMLSSSSSALLKNDAEFDYSKPNSFSSSETNIDYYGQFYRYNSGKLKSVNDVKFVYYDSFYKYSEGKIESIGNIKLTYFDNFYSYQTGKIQSIGNINFSYHDGFYDYKKGKLKSIKGNTEGVRITVQNFDK